MCFGGLWVRASLTPHIASRSIGFAVMEPLEGIPYMCGHGPCLMGVCGPAKAAGVRIPR